jgi:hypothetical protein
MSVMMLAQALAAAAQQERPTVSLLRGDVPPTSHWRPAALRNHRLLLARPRGLPPVQAAYALWVRRRAPAARSTWRRLPLLAAVGAGVGLRHGAAR